MTVAAKWTILFHRRPEIAKQRLSECGVDKPYSDPLLQHGKTYHDFLKRLHQSKLVDYSLQPGKEQIAFFFVTKKNSKLRMSVGPMPTSLIQLMCS